jgi:exopolysaccharide biosynthesis polyprenyl glycosylphosphotransferase
MFRRFSINFALFSISLDGIIVVFALAAANNLRPLLNVLPFAEELFKPSVPELLYPIFAIIWIAIFLLLSVYDGRKNLYAVDEFASLMIATLLAAVSLAGLLYFSFREVSRLLFIFFILIAFMLMFTWRIVIRISFHLRSSESIQHRKVLIVGAGPVGRDLQMRIEQYPYMGLKIVGFLDDDTGKRRSEIDVVGNLESTRDIILKHQIDDVVIALPQRAYEKVNRLISTLHDMPVKVWVIPDYFHLTLHKANIEEFAGIPMLDLRAPALTDYQRLIKRGFDLIITVFLLPVSLVLMAGIAIAIRLEGAGPILFRQERVGENGKLFEMFKFRTMVEDAEHLRHRVETINDNGQLIHKLQGDPRVTQVGRILRKTSLDELPQLINILRGEMSLVGPRPELPYLVDNYEPWQRKRFAVPQGITGWWQVNGRSDKPMHLHTEDDLYYVQNYSLLLDIQIIIKTISVVIRGRGAF